MAEKDRQHMEFLQRWGGEKIQWFVDDPGRRNLLKISMTAVYPESTKLVGPNLCWGDWLRFEFAEPRTVSFVTERGSVVEVCGIVAVEGELVFEDRLPYIKEGMIFFDHRGEGAEGEIEGVALELFELRWKDVMSRREDGDWEELHSENYPR